MSDGPILCWAALLDDLEADHVCTSENHCPPQEDIHAGGTIVDPTLVSGWDSGGCGPSVFQSASWATVLKSTYGYKPHYLVSDFAGSRSAWPIMEVSSALTGRRGVSLPFTDECEPQFSSKLAATTLFEAAVETGRARRWRYFEFRGGDSYFPHASPSVSYYTHVLHLNQGSDTLLGACDSAVRRAVKKAIQSGVRTELSHSWDAVESFFRLHCRTRRKHGLPPQPLIFFKNIYRHLVEQGKGFIVTAFHEQEPIAAGMFLHSNGQAIYKFGASNEALQHLRSNNLMMWAAICHCLTLKCESLHFGRTSLVSEGLRRFKLGWGTEERRLNYFRYDLRKGGFVAGVDQVSGWHNHFFRRVPISLSRGIGAALYRHLA